MTRGSHGGHLISMVRSKNISSIGQTKGKHMSASAAYCPTVPISGSDITSETSGPNVPMTFKTPADWINSDIFRRHQANPDNAYHKINAQQMAKNPILLDCLISDDGHSFGQLDYTSLEPYVLAEFSGCPTYKEVYASGKPHDVYFYVTCKLLDEDGTISAVYQPDNPTPESVREAKKLFKPQRNVGKVFQLMSTYKAGAAAIHRKLGLQGFDYTKEQVQEIRKEYWGPKLFGAILDYEEDLLAEVDQNDGYFVNGMGRPLVVTDKKRKDVVNTQCQSTGHDNLDLMVLYTEQLARERNIPATPVLPDFHDETVWEVPDEYTEQFGQVLKDAVAKVNGVIQYNTPLTGEPESTKNFTDFKGPDPVAWYDEKQS